MHEIPGRGVPGLLVFPIPMPILIPTPILKQNTRFHFAEFLIKRRAKDIKV